MWELGHKESWALKNWWFWTVVLEKTLESPLDCKEIQPVNRKGNQSWIFIGRTDAEAEAPVLWPPDVKNRLIGKDLDAGKDWRQEKEMTEDEVVGWHHWLDGHEFAQAPEVGDGQGSLSCCSPWGHKESAPTELLDWNRFIWGNTEEDICKVFIYSGAHISRCSRSNNFSYYYSNLLILWRKRLESRKGGRARLRWHSHLVITRLGLCI